MSEAQDSAPVEADDSVRWLREKYVAWAIEKYADIADELERLRVERDAARAEVERLTRCTCPGWCWFNPGHHHVMCHCLASKHVDATVDAAIKKQES